MPSAFLHESHDPFNPHYEKKEKETCLRNNTKHLQKPHDSHGPSAQCNLRPGIFLCGGGQIYVTIDSTDKKLPVFHSFLYS